VQTIDKTQQQLSLFSTAETNEAHLYHGASVNGFFTVNQRAPDEERLHQRSYHNSKLSQVLELLLTAGGYRGGDCYISQQSFANHTRQAVHLLNLSAAYADLDIYTPDAPEFAKSLLEISSPEDRAEALLEFIENVAKLPLPSLIMHSGRGIYAKYLFSQTIPRQALPRWNALQMELARRLAPAGIDTKSLDPCRVLRLCGTVNHKAEEHKLVRVVWMNKDGNGQTKTYDFGKLCDTVLPFTQAEVHAHHSNMEVLRANLKLEFAAAGDVRKLLRKTGDPASKLAGATLWWDRLSDIRRLVELRSDGAGILAANSRMRNSFCWLTANALAHNVPSNKLYGEICTVFREICPSFTESEIKSSASSVLSLVKSGRGPYKITNARFKKELGITAEEEHYLLTFGAGSTPKKPVNEGVMGFPKMAFLPHEEYLEETRRRRQEAARRTNEIKAQASEESRTKVLQMHAEGLGYTAIVKKTGIARSSVRRWIKEAKLSV
jgi:hypothetical protein